METRKPPWSDGRPLVETERPPWWKTTLMRDHPSFMMIWSLSFETFPFLFLRTSPPLTDHFCLTFSDVCGTFSSAVFWSLLTTSYSRTPLLRPPEKSGKSSLKMGLSFIRCIVICYQVAWQWTQSQRKELYHGSLKGVHFIYMEM